MARQRKLSKAEIKKEIIRCGRDPIYFIKNYCKISHPDPAKGIIPFTLFDFQEDVIRDFQNNRFNVINKARQLGISTTISGYSIWLMLFHREVNILTLATKQSTAANIIKKVKTAYRLLPEWIKITKVDIDNSTSFSFKNGSIIKASATSADAGRSEAVTLLIVDEAAHVEKMEDIWTAIAPTLSTGGSCIAPSSPSGAGTWFHKTCVDAQDDRNNFKYTELMWDVHPERDQAWFDNETKNMTKKDIAQELLCSFNMSGETVFSPEDLERVGLDVKDPIHKAGFDRNHWVWENYNSECSYLLVADVARGDGKDYSVYLIIKLETMEIIAEYQGKVAPDIFAEMIYHAGNEYGSCMVVVENNSVGFTVLSKLIDKSYPNVYHSVKSTHDYVEQYEAEQSNSCVAGFTTSLRTRPLIIAKLEEFIRNDIITIYSKRFLNEAKTFIWHNGRAEAMRGYNDDLIMACAIASWVRDTALVESTKDIQYKQACLNSIRKTRTILNTKIAGQPGSAIKEGEQEINKNKKNFSWIYVG